MPKTYPYELRIRVISLLKKGHKRKEVSDIFDVPIPTIDKWVKLKKYTGDVRAKENFTTGRKPKIRTKKDIEKLKIFVEKNNHLSLHDMADKWGNVCYVTIYRMMKRLGYSFKKSLSSTQKEIKSSEKSLSPRWTLLSSQENTK